MDKLQNTNLKSSSVSNQYYRSCKRKPYINHKHDFILKKLKPAIQNSKSCPICMTHQIKQPAVISVCLHTYCTHCILKWSQFKTKCPLCNAVFVSLFLDIDLLSLTYRTRYLSGPVVKESSTRFSNSNVGGIYARRRDFMVQRREQVNVNRKTRPLPRQRSFGQSSKESILHWRASIYEQNMCAVPCPSRKSLKQGFGGSKSYKEMLLQKIEPWIHRELHAVLEDPNPTILVHLVTSLYISSLEETPSVPSGVKDNYLERLRPFLLGQTNTFWHELRCFAESSFNMETYDTVVKYVKWSN
uniref:E3 ubiquitin-protein ligase Topors n=1 Tax=Erigeron canadensis TaxID=72917 RepID=UPI001CB9D47A|nr:E3 ubiquitin-protein ligase Topors [Erigeron canadensis]